MSKKNNQEKQARRQARTARRGAHKSRRGRRPNVPKLNKEQLSGMPGLGLDSMVDTVKSLMVTMAARHLGLDLSLSLLTMAQLVKDGKADTAAPEFECIPRPGDPIQ